MAKSGSKGKSNFRQRKKKDEKLSKEDDDDFADPTKMSSKSKVNIPAVLVAGGLLALLVASAILPSPEDPSSSSIEKDSSKNQKDPLESQRKLEQQGDGTIARFVKDSYKVLKTLPHDTKSFTQGLTFRPDDNSIVYESTGMYNESVVRILDLSNGEVLKEVDIPGQYFGEGLSYFRDKTNENDEGRMILITWKEKTGFIYDMDNLSVLEEFSYTTTTNEGWGIIHVPEANEFIVSDGSPYLHFWDMKYQEIRPKVKVTYQTSEMVAKGIPRQPLKMLNELEWDPNTKTILSNVWYQNVVVRIDPRTGHVLTIYDLGTLYTDRLPTSDVFNGIALSSKGDLWVTGKYWPHLYQIELSEP